MRLEIDTWRWAGVPFLIRAGKRLPVTAAEVVVELHRPPADVFGEPEPARDRCRHFRFRLSPEVVIALGARAKAPGEAMRGEDVELLVRHHAEHELMAPYERLLRDALDGDPGLFAREDAVEAAWAAVDPILGDAVALHAYDPQTWGPAEAERLSAGVGGWHDPAKTGTASHPRARPAGRPAAT